MTLTSDQERVIDALTLYGGGFAAVEPWGASEVAVQVRLPGGLTVRVLDDGKVITPRGDIEGSKLVHAILECPYPDLANYYLRI